MDDAYIQSEKKGKKKKMHRCVPPPGGGRFTHKGKFEC